jgi:hypothetical protein
LSGWETKKREKKDSDNKQIENVERERFINTKKREILKR